MTELSWWAAQMLRRRVEEPSVWITRISDKIDLRISSLDVHHMESNPIVDRQKEAEEEYRKQKAFRYPFRIHCVYLPEDGHDFPVFHEVKKYCDENNLTFCAREYNVDKYGEDMFIKRLLAFHIYYRGYVQETHYYDNDPVHKIQLVVWAYQDVEKEKARARQRRQEKWEKFKESWNSMFTLDHFKQKPALDRDASQSKKRMSPDG